MVGNGFGGVDPSVDVEVGHVAKRMSLVDVGMKG